MIRGIVIDQTEKPVSKVLVKSNIESTITDEKGYFTIRTTGKDTLIFHRIGYRGQVIPEIDIKGTIILERENIELEGYTLNEIHSSEIENLEIKRIKLDSNSGSSLTEVLSKESNMINQAVHTQGTRQTVAIPGFDARHTLIMLDGIPLNSSGEAVDLSLIPLSLVEEVEIITGNLTGKVASGGMGVVLNIKTKSNQDNFSYEVGQEVRSYDFLKTSALGAIKYKRLNCQAALEYQEADNDFKYCIPEYWNSEIDRDTRKNNKFRQIDIASKIMANIGQSKLEYKVFHTDFYRMLPGPVNNPELFNLARIEGFVSRHQLQFLQYFGRLKFTADGWINVEESVYDNTRLEEPFCNFPIYNIYGESEKKMTGIRPEFSRAIGENLNGVIGLEYLQETYHYDEKTNPVNSISRIKQKTLSEYLGINHEFRMYGLHNSISANYRIDDNSEFDKFSSYSFRNSISKDDFVELAFIYTNGYTFPSFHNLYWKGDAESIGNPDLLPERNESYQVQGTIRSNQSKIMINWRRDNLKDMIDWVQTFTKAWKPINISSADIENIEIVSDIVLGEHLIINGVWNWTYTKDRTILESGNEAASYGKELIYTPDYNGKVGMEFSFNKFNAGIEAVYTGSQWTTRDQLTSEKQLEAYDLYNAHLGYDIEYRGMDVRVIIIINNLQNRFYQIYDYMPQPGRNYNLKINIRKGEN